LLTEAATTDLYVPAVQRQIKRLRELAPPEADEETLNAINDDAQTTLDSVEADPSIAPIGNVPDPFAAVDMRLAEYGLTACAE
jgi:hypothetical protein